jgi:hypothetical protein
MLSALFHRKPRPAFQGLAKGKFIPLPSPDANQRPSLCTRLSNTLKYAAPLIVVPTPNLLSRLGEGLSTLAPARKHKPAFAGLAEKVKKLASSPPSSPAVRPQGPSQSLRPLSSWCKCRHPRCLTRRARLRAGLDGRHRR